MPRAASPPTQGPSAPRSSSFVNRPGLSFLSPFPGLFPSPERFLSLVPNPSNLCKRRWPDLAATLLGYCPSREHQLDGPA